MIVAVTNPKMSTTGGWDWDKALQEMPGRWTEVADELFSFSHEMHNCGCQSVFDLGCGAGRHSVFLAQQGFAVSASDISPSAIEKTRANLQQAGTDATLYQIDMTEWPFSDAQFDAVVAFNVVYHAHRAEVETILHQINRVLSPGGRFCFIDGYGRPTFRAIHQAVRRFGVSFVAAALYWCGSKDCFLRDEAGTDHDRGITRVGAARYCRDDDVAVVHVEGATIRLEAAL